MTGDTALQDQTTTYDYRIDPTQVTVGATVQLVLTIFNKALPGEPGSAGGDDQVLQMLIPAGDEAVKLTANPLSIKPSSRTPGWRAVLRTDADSAYVDMSGPAI